MSGPKVVRIVTREELIDICQGLLARLEAAVSEWIRVGQRSDCVSDAEIAKAKEGLVRMQRLLEKDEFEEIQKLVPAEVAFLQDDQLQRLAKAAEKAARQRTSERRQCEAAGALLVALRRSGVALDSSLEDALKNAAGGVPNQEAIAAGFALLSAQNRGSGTGAHALAQRLKSGDDHRSFADWLAAQPKPPTDSAVAALERKLAELAIIEGRDACTGFDARLSAAAAEADDARRSLLLDSLALDVAGALTVVRARTAISDDLRLILAELAQAGSKAHGDLTRRAQSASKVQLEALAEEARRALAAERAAQSAKSRRDAVLRGLSSLGYEVTEGLQTAWASDGRIILRKAARPDYGVEITGDLTAPRVQMRAVAFDGDSTEADPMRDKDAEQLWCGDVAELQSVLKKEGGELAIERALSVGAIPLKRVADAMRHERDVRAEPSTKSRTLGSG